MEEKGRRKTDREIKADRERGVKEVLSCWEGVPWHGAPVHFSHVQGEDSNFFISEKSF